MRYRSVPPAALAREELCIKFVNTVAWRRSDHPEDRAASPDAMLKWLADAELAERPAVGGIRARWKRMPREAGAFLETAMRLREAIYSLLIARIRGQRADPASLDILNRHLSSSSAPGLAQSRIALKWHCAAKADAETLLKPIAWSAAGLLMGPRAQKLRQCQDDRGCGWLFIDESRAQNRRWCSMGDCGNLAKSRRHYRRVAHSSAASQKSDRSSSFKRHRE
jgi:predicted RNA-binding Zn ribbon-like protein